MESPLAPTSSHPVKRRRTVLTRLLVSYAIVTVSFALVAGYSVVGQRRSVRETELLRAGYMPLALALRDAVADQNTYNSQLSYITEAKNPAAKEVWFVSLITVGRPKTFAEVRAALARAFGPSEGEIGSELARETTRVERFVAEDKDSLTQLFSALRAGRDEEAEKRRSELVRRGAQALSQLRALEQRVNRHLDTLTSAAYDRERWALRVLLAWAGMTVLLGAVAAVYAGRVLRPLVSITRRAEAVANGDLTPQAVTASDDEIGELAQTFESMVVGIAQANKQLLESERLATIGKMAAQVTHEVRNPLSSIGLNLELLEEEIALGDLEEARALCGAIKKESERLTELTAQYLAIAGQKAPCLQPESPEEVIEELAAFVAPELRKASLELVMALEAELPRILWDEAQIRQVLLNLLRNARQASTPGGRVWLSAWFEPAPPTLVMTVSDEGEGVAEDVRERLFEPFFTTKQRGTGLGLAISRQVVEAHRGTISCAPNLPHGTTFTLKFPVEIGQPWVSAAPESIELP